MFTSHVVGLFPSRPRIPSDVDLQAGRRDIERRGAPVLVIPGEQDVVTPVTLLPVKVILIGESAGIGSTLERVGVGMPLPFEVLDGT